VNEPTPPVDGFPLDGYHRVPRPMRLEPVRHPLKILFLYSRPPLPMTRGDELTVSHLLEFLHARGHVVDFVTLAESGQGLRPEHRAWLESRCRRVELIPHSLKRSLPRAAAGWLGGKPFQIGLLLSPHQLRRVRELAGEERYDLAYAYYIRSAEALRAARAADPALVTFMALQLSQTLNTERLARTAATPWDRLFYRFETRRMARYEARLWSDVNRTVLIGEKDRAAIAAACRAEGLPEIDNVVWGPHGVDVERFRPRPQAEEPETVIMSGVMRYAPNVEAALWFAREVWPLVRARRPGARFLLVGRDPTPALQTLGGQNGITVTGTVEEPADWIARAAVCVAPIRAAAGLQNKLLEAMAMAKAVVATPEANEGIGAPVDEALLLAREPGPFAQAILALLADPARRERLGKAARTFVEAKWTWEGPFLELEQAFLAVVEAKPGARATAPSPVPRPAPATARAAPG
jgi:sugar transferase (PEP-CTERM/EpsH1 system associated)